MGYMELGVFFINGIQKKKSFFPKLFMSSKVSVSSWSAVSGRKTAGKLPNIATTAIIRKPLVSLKPI